VYVSAGSLSTYESPNIYARVFVPIYMHVCM